MANLIFAGGKSGAGGVAPADVLSAACPSREVLNRMTTKWGVLVLLVLSGGTHRFAQLRRRIGGVSERMLAQTLQQLEGVGLIDRRSFDVVPPHVEYSLTPLGREAAGHVAALTGWIEANLPGLLPGMAEDTEDVGITSV